MNLNIQFQMEDIRKKKSKQVRINHHQIFLSQLEVSF